MPNTSKGTGMKKHAMNLTELKQLIQDGRDAMQYAWDHYEELVAREAVHILYGPSDYGIGAGIPGKFIPVMFFWGSELNRQHFYQHIR